MKYFRVTFALLIGFTCLLASDASSSGEWNLRRNTGNGACSVQPVESMPQLGAFLAKHPTRKAACEDAKLRHTDDAADTTKCFTYTSGTKDECKKDGVDLPD
jgi:hypothetical protein